MQYQQRVGPHARLHVQAEVQVLAGRVDVEQAQTEVRVQRHVRDRHRQTERGRILGRQGAAVDRFRVHQHLQIDRELVRHVREGGTDWAGEGKRD